MANNPYKNKIVYNGTTLIDLTGDDVTASDVAQGKKFHLPSGQPAVGTATGGSITVVDTQDSHGGIIRTITAETIQTQTKSATPSESQQTVNPDEGYLLSSVTVGAISSTYVGSGVSRKAAATINTSSSDQTIASGTYLTGAQTIKAVTVSGLSAGNIAAGVTVKVGDANDDDRITSVTGTLAFVTYYTGSTDPASSLGSNGDIYLKVAN